jgi:flagellar hook-basal body complex protein FliE
MSTEEQARELLTQQRHDDEHLRESMLDRAEAEVDNPNDADNLTQKQARELVAEQRHNDEHLKEAMLNRAKADISISSKQ